MAKRKDKITLSFWVSKRVHRLVDDVPIVETVLVKVTTGESITVRGLLADQPLGGMICFELVKK